LIGRGPFDREEPVESGTSGEEVIAAGEERYSPRKMPLISRSIYEALDISKRWKYRDMIGLIAF
jgi:hypothetical protein